MAASTGVAGDDMDGLLERYLGLLDEYTKLRSTLTDLQASVYQNIARANFSAERGIRYGQDLYDERMQATRTLAICQGEEESPKFEIVARKDEKKDVGGDGNEESDKKGPANEQVSADEKEDVNVTGADHQKDVKEQAPKPVDPMRWFGILAPLPLRQAQSKSTQAVEQIIPRLVTINAEMAGVEIRVRRARKKRAKAEAAAVNKRAFGDVKPGTAEEGVASSQKDAENAIQKLASLNVGDEARSTGITA